MNAAEWIFVTECKALASAVAVLVGECAESTAIDLMTAFGMSVEDAVLAIKRCGDGYWMDNAFAFQSARKARR